MNIITWEALRVDAQIIKRMLERIGLRPRLDVMTFTEWLRKIYIPLLDKPPEEQQWDMCIGIFADWWGHTAASILTLHYLEESDYRWIE
ncbi:MAG: hypothetical protein ACETWD_02800, partial [Desulfatiglandales bacterium]